MSDETAALVGFMGNFGLFSTVAGLAVMLLMPERTGRRFGGAMAILGGAGMGYELLLAHAF